MCYLLIVVQRYTYSSFSWLTFWHLYLLFEYLIFSALMCLILKFFLDWLSLTKWNQIIILMLLTNCSRFKEESKVIKKVQYTVFYATKFANILINQNNIMIWKIPTRLDKFYEILTSNYIKMCMPFYAITFSTNISLIIIFVKGKLVVIS